MASKKINYLTYLLLSSLLAALVMVNIWFAQPEQANAQVCIGFKLGRCNTKDNGGLCPNGSNFCGAGYTKINGVVSGHNHGSVYNTYSFLCRTN